jgi:Zn ribbon nucleic-acid-binding protein
LPESFSWNARRFFAGVPPPPCRVCATMKLWEQALFDSVSRCFPQMWLRALAQFQYHVKERHSKAHTPAFKRGLSLQGTAHSI